jgi:hypothetical protein
MGTGGLHELLKHLCPGFIQLDTHAFQHPGGDSLTLAHKSEEQVLRADDMPVQPERFVLRQCNRLLPSRRQADRVGRHKLAASDDELDRRAHSLRHKAKASEEESGVASVEASQAEQQVFSTDVGMLMAKCFLVGERDYSPGVVGEALGL